MMKIGILTYFWQDNPGTFLQALSVLRAVQRRFPDARVEMIDYKAAPYRFHIAKRYVNPLYLLEGYRRHRAYARCQRQHLPVSEASRVTDDYEEAARFIEGLGYDLIVVGSDTVLELFTRHRERGEPPIYWLPPRMKCKKVACAVSVNAVTAESLDGKMKARLAESINAFDLVGVRDDATYDLIKALGLRDESKLCRVPDPTFSFDIDYGPAEAVLKAHRIDRSTPLVGVCLLPELGRAVTQHYRSKGFGVVSLNWTRYTDWCPWAISPFVWAGLYRYLALVVTERFHGSVFSLKNGTPLVTLEIDEARHITPAGLSKRYTLLNQFGLRETSYLSRERMRDVGEVLRAADAALESFDRDKVARTVQRMRAQFDAFMDRAALAAR